MSENTYGVSNNDAATLALLYGGNRRGGIGVGGDYGYGSDVIAAKGLANGTAENAKLDSLKQDVQVSYDRMTDFLRDRQFQDVASDLQDVRREIVQQAGDSRAETIDRVNTVNQNLCDLSKELQQCCCDIKTEVLKENAATRELINARALDEAQRENDRADRRANSGDIVNAINQGNQLLLQAIQNQQHHHWPRGRVAE